MSRRSLRVGAASVAVVAAGLLIAGCDAGDSLFPPGGQVSITYHSDAATTGTTQDYAFAYAWFLSDFVANDPADDPSINHYADLPIEECVAPVQTGAGNSQYTYADPGGVLVSGPVTVTLNLYTNGELSHYADMNPSSFQFNAFYDVELTGSDEIPATTFDNAIASGDEIAFTAPAGMHGDLVTIPNNQDLTFTYDSTQSEIMAIAITDNQGTSGLMCRVDPGAGGTTNFVVTGAEVASLPSTGIIVAFTYNFREDVLDINGESRSVSFIGQTIRSVRYQKQ